MVITVDMNAKVKVKLFFAPSLKIAEIEQT